MKSEETTPYESLYQTDGSKIPKSPSPLMRKWTEELTSEAMDLLYKFTQWRENSRRHLVDVIDSYNKSIDEGFNDLINEISDLHARVSVIKHEIYDLPEKVVDFSDCVTVTMPMEANLVEQNENTNPKSSSPIKMIEEKEMIESSTKIEKRIKDLQHRFGNRVIISPKLREENQITNQVIKPQNQIPLKEEASFSEAIFEDNVKNNAEGEESKEDVAELVQNYISARNIRLGKTFTCDYCQYETTSKQDLLTHKQKYDHHKKWKCDRCPFETRVGKYQLKIHINDIHDKVRKYPCPQCEYAATNQGSLWKHKRFVHKMGEKKCYI